MQPSWDLRPPILHVHLLSLFFIHILFPICFSLQCNKPGKQLTLTVCYVCFPSEIMFHHANFFVNHHCETITTDRCDVLQPGQIVIRFGKSQVRPDCKYWERQLSPLNITRGIFSVCKPTPLDVNTKGSNDQLSYRAFPSIESSHWSRWHDSSGVVWWKGWFRLNWC